MTEFVETMKQLLKAMGSVIQAATKLAKKNKGWTMILKTNLITY